ncbi:unnamed protein product, partial [Staurois parvus]
ERPRPPPRAPGGLHVVEGSEVTPGKKVPCILILSQQRDGQYMLHIRTPGKGASDDELLPITNTFKCVQEAEEPLLIDISTNSGCKVRIQADPWSAERLFEFPDEEKCIELLTEMRLIQEGAGRIKAIRPDKRESSNWYQPTERAASMSGASSKSSGSGHLGFENSFTNIENRRNIQNQQVAHREPPPPPPPPLERR